ncbi:MAG: hypothetical protein ACTSQY_05040 [Candidatus Odinarchaeia archaeon]
MSEQLNSRILEKLEEYQCDDIIKKFLKEMLFFELQNLEFAKPPYTKHYDDRIEKAAKEYKKKKGDNK